MPNAECSGSDVREVLPMRFPLKGLRYHGEETTCTGHLEKDANVYSKLCTVKVDFDESL